MRYGRSFARGFCTVATASSLALVGAGTATAGPTDAADASLDYSSAVAEVALINGAALADVDDNITCSIPTAGGSQVNPRFQYVVGEVYGNDVIFAEWDCLSRDTGLKFSISGTVTDYAYFGGKYQPVGGGSASAASTAAVAAIAPNKINAFAGGSGALNTYHYARFNGITSTGKPMSAVSQLFYVASN